MADTHVQDASWDTDLIWHYFHSLTTEAGPGRFRQYFKNQDPLSELNNRHRIYEMLVDEPAHTKPALQATADESMKKYKESKIPWNQNNGGFLTAVNNEYWCGSIIKIVFIRYMKWKDKEPTPAPVGKDIGKAAAWTIKNLENNVPVRASLGGQHYVGIVGHRSVAADTEFLCIDPWAYGTDGKNTSMTYAGAATAFLGISKRAGSSWTYGTGGQIVQWVEAP